LPKNLKRYYEQRHLHFITCSCYRRLPLLTPVRRDAVLRHIERVRQKYRFAVLGYVIMPEHIHLLISKPEIDDPSVVMSVIKQGTARQFLSASRTTSDRLRSADHFWQKRFYDFNVYSERKRIEKLKYMHRNPVKRGLVGAPEEWQWSSFRFYYLDEPGLLTVTKFEDL
jgi:putative transposase